MSALHHSPDHFVLLPFRKSEKDTPDWSLCSKYIATNHSSNNTTTVDDALKSMAAYHNSIVKSCQLDSKSSPTESFIEHTVKEYCKLVAMAQAHLPLNGGKISKSLHYVWHDSFTNWDKYDCQNSNAELISSIYNLAASYVFVAVGQAETGTVDGVKDAFKNFQSAAGYYSMVESLLSRMPPEQLTKGDMKKDSLQMLTRVCLAQAHHCGYLKAEEAMKGKHEMLSKIAMEGAKQYEEAHALMKASTWYAGKSTPAKDCETVLLASRYVLQARAYLHLAVKNDKDGEMGVAIAYYMKAKESLAKLPKMPTQPLTLWVNSIVNSVNKAQDVADKANSSVYYARVPKEVPTPESLPRPLGQATDHASFVAFKSARGHDPFFGIMPAHIATQAAQWREKQRKLVHVCTVAATSGRKASTEKMQQLGVMAAIQTMSGELQDRGRVPEPLRSNILKLRGGNTEKTTAVTQKLVDHVQTCQEVQKLADGKLQEIKSELASEKTDEQSYLTSYGEKMWRSVCPPAEQTPDYNAIMAAYEEHKKSLTQYVVTPFGAAQKVLDENLRDVARLDWNMTDLDALMPFVQTKEARQQSSKVTEYIDKLKTIVSNKEMAENEQMAEQRALMDLVESDEVVFGLSSVESGQRDAILAQGGQSIADAIERVNKKTREQANLAADAEKTMEELSKIQSADPVAQEIQKVANGLENACNVYLELSKELESIVQYASKLMESIDASVGSAKSFRMVRKLNAEELQQRLDAQIAKKMSEMKDVESDIQRSRQRQQELQTQINTMQMGRPGAYGGAQSASVPPPQQQPAASSPPQDDRPPTYDELMAYSSRGAAAPSYQQPPPPADDTYSYGPMRRYPAGENAYTGNPQARPNAPGPL